VGQNIFTAGNGHFMIIPKTTLLSGIATRIVFEGQRIELVTQWDIKILG
jgi:hypothetical protein